MRVTKSIINQKGIRILGFLPVHQVIHDLFPMPVTSLFIRSPTTGTVVTNSEKFVGGLVTVSILTGTHGVITGTIKNGR